MRQVHIDLYASGEGDGKPYEIEHGEVIPYRELPPALRGLKFEKRWATEADMPIDESHDAQIEEGGIKKWKEQLALIFVDESRGNYGALILTGTAGVKAEQTEFGRYASDHEGLEKVYPRTKGLHIFEGELVFSDPDRGPEWQGQFRSITKSDFEKLGV